MLSRRIMTKLNNSIALDGLLGYWHYKSGVSGLVWKNVAPATLGSYDGTITGAVLQSDGVFFDGNDDYVSFPLALKTDYVTYEISFSLSDLIKNRGLLISQTLTYGTHSVIRVTTTGAISLMFGLDNNYSYNLVSSPNALISVGQTTITVAFNRLTKKAKCYINGVFVMDFDFLSSNTYESNMGDIYLGKDDYGFFTKGKIHFIRVYNRILSDTEISQNYGMGIEKIGF